MILLQAAMAAGLILIVIFGVILLIGIPLLTGFFVKLFWRVTNKSENIENKVAYYKDKWPFVISVWVSFFILATMFYLLILWFDKSFSGFS